MQFYLKKVEFNKQLKIGMFTSSYRCKGDNIDKFKVTLINGINDIYERTSSNHMGNAIDIAIYKNNDILTTLMNCDTVRELFAIYTSATIRWHKDGFNLEPSLASYKKEYIAPNWVHIDCREFSSSYLNSEYYCVSEAGLKGTSFINGNFIETSDSGKFEGVNNCIFIPDSMHEIIREETLWLGLIKDAYLLEFQDSDIDLEKSWNVKFSTLPTKSSTNLGLPRIQEIVIIADETDLQYKITPRKGDVLKEGWIDKKYIKEICKYEKKI